MEKDKSGIKQPADGLKADFQIKWLKTNKSEQRLEYEKKREQ